MLLNLLHEVCVLWKSRRTKLLLYLGVRRWGKVPKLWTMDQVRSVEKRRVESAAMRISNSNSWVNEQGKDNKAKKDPKQQEWLVLLFLFRPAILKPPPISVPKRKLPSSQSQHRFYWNSSCDWLIHGFLFGTKMGGSQLIKTPCTWEFIVSIKCTPIPQVFVHPRIHLWICNQNLILLRLAKEGWSGGTDFFIDQLSDVYFLCVHMACK